MPLQERKSLHTFFMPSERSPPIIIKIITIKKITSLRALQ
jgi:hypothetical protein